MFPNIKKQTKHLSTKNGEALTAPLHLSYKLLNNSFETDNYLSPSIRYEPNILDHAVEIARLLHFSSNGGFKCLA